MGSTIIKVIIILIILLIILSGIKIVPQTEIFIIERLGKYHKQWDAGIHLKLPVIDKVVKKVSIKERVLDFQPQAVITKDNVTMKIDSVVFLKVFDAKLYAYGVENPLFGVENLAATTLRNLVGSMDFDETLTSRDIINTQMEQVLDEATDAWGIKVTRVEVKDIQPPMEIQEVMTKQMRAEREKRQAILEAEAHKQSIVTRAEGDKAAKVMAAEAERDARIALAEGEATSIRKVYEAEADGIRMLKESNIDRNVLSIKSLEALEKVADGNSTKIFMPTDIMNTVSSLGVMAEALGIGNAMPVNEKVEKADPVKVDPCIKPSSSYISKEVSESSYNVQRDLEKQEVEL